MSGPRLLDANVLIPLVVVEHEFRERAAAYVAQLERVALCPIVEGALVRYLLRAGESGVVAARLLADVRSLPQLEFWPDSISYADVHLEQLSGHRQVTDAYLAMLALAHGGKLATFDRGLANSYPTAVDLVE